MRKRKQFNAPPPTAIVLTPEDRSADPVASALIRLPDNPYGYRNIDLRRWLGKGIDAWVTACADQLRAFIAGRELSPLTIFHYAAGGLRYLFEFIMESGEPIRPQDMDPRHLRLYVGWLKQKDWAYGNQRNHYVFTKSVLEALVRRGAITDQKGLFPANPFPNSRSQMNGATALSHSERSRLAHVLRDELVAIREKRFEGSESAALVVMVLAVAIRTGANPTPLLEARRDCLRRHPFLPNLMLLELFKRRGNATKLVNLRYSREEANSLAIPMDGVALIRSVRDASESLVAEAKVERQDRLWLYRAEAGRNFGRVVALTGQRLALGISTLIARRDLRGDDGEPLRLNLSRLRKTLEQRLWALSGGDLIATAALMGHHPTVADNHYLACTEKIRENATFVGEALAEIYEKGPSDAGASSVLPGKSPTGRCKDPYSGDRAPKNGRPCDDFLSCFACTSYTIVGSPDDLHRLFSFYWFLDQEITRARTADWQAEFRNTMNLIDRFTADKFDVGVVAAAKARAKSEPLPFWAAYRLNDVETTDD
ncbi:hypothetical protein ACS7SF_23945 (plasmid) [Ralstonia sp. 25C]|uniref:hypothetical protein n=1 Tax=Ralstonia sp. 25C TaxID=3447363 RepID=UPI003F74E781